MKNLDPPPVRGWSGFLRDIREACASGDPHALAEVWTRGRTRPRVGALVRMVELFYPVEPVLSLAAELDSRISRDGLCDASRWLLDTWVGAWRALIPPSVTEVLSTAPALIYGNHPSLLTPFLVAASTCRSDLKIISASFLQQLLPSYAPHSLPVFVPMKNWGEQFRRGGFPRLLVASLVHHLRPPMPPETAKEMNRQALEGAVSHIQAGGAVLIAPGGWSVRRWPWHPGIGRIVHALARDPGSSDCWLFPFRERYSSDARVRATFGRSPISRVKRRCLRRRPVTIQFGQPIRRSALDPLPNDVQETVRSLQSRYDILFGGTA